MKAAARPPSPSPEQVRALRRDANLSASKAAALVHTSPRAWLQWESGDRAMHPAFWELATIKVRSL